MSSDCETTLVIVKNSFIEWVLPKPVQRRCASVPSSLRLNYSTGKAQLPETQQLSKGQGWEAESSFSHVSDASTDSGVASDEESVDSAPTTVASSSPLWPLDNNSLLVEQVQDILAADLQAELVLTYFSQEDQKHDTKLNSQAEAFIPKTKLKSQAAAFTPKTKLKSQAEAFTPAGTKLSTQAKVFTPGCCLLQKPPGTKLTSHARQRCAHFRWQCSDVILAAKEALATCMFVQSLELLVEKSSRSINAYISPEHYQCKEKALSKAKQALLDTAEKSQGVYVLGYRGKPFMATTNGFFAILAIMTCEKQACWDKFCYGHCHGELTCTLQHPVYQMPVYVNIEFTTVV